MKCINSTRNPLHACKLQQWYKLDIKLISNLLTFLVEGKGNQDMRKSLVPFQALELGAPGNPELGKTVQEEHPPLHLLLQCMCVAGFKATCHPVSATVESYL